jgi:beta-1,4-mannosyl-glycoprotein beta-1,4-N-acetylglucosaminyltransferase
MVIDAFPFNDELDMLEMRLGQMNEVADHFVIIEVARTYRGDPKPLYYRDNIERFSKWNHKIHCISPTLPNVGSWEFEVIQRDALLGTIKSLNPKPEDTITFSDCDEIPNPEVVRSYTPDLGLRNLRQYTFWYNYNHLFDYGGRAWSRARIGRIADIYERGVMHFRGGPQDDLDPNFPALDNGGWHGTYFGSSIERIRRKINSFSHDDLVPFIKGRSDKQLAEDIHNGVNLYHLAGVPNSTVVDSDDPVRVPPYFRQNKERFNLFTNAYFAEKYRDLLIGPETGAGLVKEVPLAPKPRPIRAPKR